VKVGTKKSRARSSLEPSAKTTRASLPPLGLEPSYWIVADHDARLAQTLDLDGVEVGAPRR
jgi:hypothetical protein